MRRDSSSIPLKVWNLFRATFRAGRSVYFWCKKYPKLASFIIITPLMLTFCYFIAIASMDSQDWESTHCRKTGRSQVPNVVVVGDNFPIAPTVQAQYEYECDDGRMVWHSY